ncbi:DDB1- and CUL4-associated factor 17 [Bombina bombina]|uniref:DDB1- and CUL4-associated factor 17 n=1 Tax=Bombina bombina TaxID=8345 RepID=UPI00235AEAA4|nr:DDB1- and CUL4-associated factor 17 [Bombina bombina]XP_053554403.1 DDB1- and CUL4-associated factor 17 [Bombina bombina]
MREEVHPGLTLHQSSVCKKASQRKNTLKNVCSVISTRPLGSFTNSAGDLLRQNMDILRKLVCQKNTIFQNVWTKHSKSSISYAKGRIYFDNFRCCFNSIPTKPQQIYEMPRCSKLEKIEDALLCEGPVGESLPQKSDYTPSLIAVTGHNWLLRLSAHTGETLEKVYLGSYRKFRYFAWDLPQETLVLKSIQRKATTMQQETGSHGAVLFYLAVFSVYPFALLGIMEINKDIFGSNVTDAMISHGMLIVMHSVGLVRIYSFEKIAEQYMQQKLIIGHSCSWKGETGTVGQYPFGIPCNITFTESPPFLFEVSCQDNAFQVGGFPWHYIITPNKKKDKGCFHVRSLDDHSLAKNGILDMKCCSLEPDWIHFHPDASERIIHVGPNQINVLRLKELQNDSHSHQVVEDFVILASRERQVNNLVTKTASGRLVKKRFSLLDDDPEQETFKIVTYEDELDLLTVVAVTQTEAEGKAHVDLHCNETGKILKKIPLLESWDVTFSHAVFFDRDTLVHIEERPNRHFSCYVYKMQRNFAE